MINGPQSAPVQVFVLTAYSSVRGAHFSQLNRSAFGLVRDEFFRLWIPDKDILIPSSSSPRLVRLENELLERVVSQYSHILSHQNIIRKVFSLSKMRRSDWSIIFFLKTNLSLALMAGKFNLTARILFKVNHHIKLPVIFMARFDMNLLNIAINLFFQGECKIKSSVPQCH